MLVLLVVNNTLEESFVCLFLIGDLVTYLRFSDDNYGFNWSGVAETVLKAALLFINWVMVMCLLKFLERYNHFPYYFNYFNNNEEERRCQSDW